MALTYKRKAFTKEYITDFHITNAAIRAGYSERSAYSVGSELMKNLEIRAEIDRLLDEKAMTYGETIERIGRFARGELGEKKEELRALELIGKKHAMFTDKVDIAITSEMSKLLQLFERELDEDTFNKILQIIPD